MPITALKARNNKVKPLEEKRLNPKFIARMKPSGASITTQPMAVCAPVSTLMSISIMPDEAKYHDIAAVTKRPATIHVKTFARN